MVDGRINTSFFGPVPGEIFIEESLKLIFIKLKIGDPIFGGRQAHEFD